MPIKNIFIYIHNINIIKFDQLGNTREAPRHNNDQLWTSCTSRFKKKSDVFEIGEGHLQIVSFERGK